MQLAEPAPSPLVPPRSGIGCRARSSPMPKGARTRTGTAQRPPRAPDTSCTPLHRPHGPGARPTLARFVWWPKQKASSLHRLDRHLLRQSTRAPVRPPDRSAVAHSAGEAARGDIGWEQVPTELLGGAKLSGEWSNSSALHCELESAEGDSGLTKPMRSASQRTTTKDQCKSPMGPHVRCAPPPCPPPLVGRARTGGWADLGFSPLAARGTAGWKRLIVQHREDQLSSHHRRRGGHRSPRRPVPRVLTVRVCGSFSF